jgi:hypothetical protein
MARLEKKMKRACGYIVMIDGEMAEDIAMAESLQEAKDMVEEMVEEGGSGWLGDETSEITIHPIGAPVKRGTHKPGIAWE